MVSSASSYACFEDTDTQSVLPSVPVASPRHQTPRHPSASLLNGVDSTPSTPSIPPSPSPIATPPHLPCQTPRVGAPNYLASLCRLHGKQLDFKVLYSSEWDLFNSRDFFCAITGRKRIFILLVTAQGHAFGSYHLHLPKQRGEWLTKDRSHYVFSLVNPTTHPPIRFSAKPGPQSVLYVASENNSKDLVCVVGKLFNVWARGSFVSEQTDEFQRQYDVPFEMSPKFFTGTCFPDRFDLSYFLVLTF